MFARISASDRNNMGDALSPFLFIKNPKLREEYRNYTQDRSSGNFILFLVVVCLFVLLPLDIIFVSRDPNEHLMGTTISLVICYFIVIIVGLFLFLMKRFPTMFLLCSQSSSMYYDICLAFFLFFFTISNILRFFRHSLLHCDLHNDNWLFSLSSVWACRSESTAQIPWSTGLFMIALPSTYMHFLGESRVYVVLLSNISSFAALLIITLLKAEEDFISILLMMILSSMYIIDVHFLNVSSYFTLRKISNDLFESECVTQKAHAIEMRHLIANVAHDLKTPLSSYITGLDLIEQAVDDCKQSLYVGVNDITVFADAIYSICRYVDDIRHTNSFMLMAINRCIDYTKATNGLKLIPRHETINLIDTLQLPLNCMKNIQNRIEIRLNPLANEISNYIITDKQWLQENILCLLSNAVKYSTGGFVTISILLEDDEHSLPKELINEVTRSPESIQYSVASTSGVSSRRSYRILDSFRKSMFNSFSLSPDRVSPEPSEPPSGRSQLDGHRHRTPIKNLFTHTQVLRFEVEDTGIGMSDEAMQTLFNPFKQTQRLAGGTGLGLYSLAKRVEALNGRYGVQKRKDGQQGSLFWFEIPYRPDNNTQLSGLVSPMKRKSVVSIEIPKACMKPDLTNIEEKSLPTPTPASSSRQTFSLNILVVDDAPSIIKMTSMMLRKQGHKIDTAENGQIALDKIQEKWKGNRSVFDIVLMDLQMPVMDGLETTRRLREIEKDSLNGSSDTEKLDSTHGSLNLRPKQIVIGVSANSDNETANEALSVGFDAFIPKPFNLDIFYSTVNRLLDGNDTDGE